MSTLKPGVQGLDRYQIQLASDFDAQAGMFVYQRICCDIKTDTTISRLWRCDVEGGRHRPLQQGASQQSGGRLSPDGRQLAWIDTASGNAQIHLMDLASGQGGQISRLNAAPSLLSWSPCGSYLAFVMSVPRAAADWVQMTQGQPGCDWAPPPEVIDRLPYKMDGAGFLPNAASQIFVLDLQSGQARQLTDLAAGINDAFTVQAPVWAPDGQQILFLHNGSDKPWLTPRCMNVWSVSVDDQSLIQVTDFAGSCAGFAISPDAAHLAVLMAPDNEESWTQNQLWLVERSSGRQTRLAQDLDRSIGEFLDNGGRPLCWSPDGNAILALYDESGHTVLGRFETDGGYDVVVRDLAQGSSGYGLGAGFAALAEGAFIFTRGRATHWPEIYRQDAQGRAHAITAMNQQLASQRTLAQVRHMEFHNPKDGQALEAWLYTPPHFDPTCRYSLILEIHGGPHNNFGDRFWPRSQLMAAAGYCILLVNPRGSTSYGHAFTRGIEHCYPGPDIDDLLAGVDAACALAFIDADNLFVTGISGGGTLTTALVAATDRFRAAAALCPFVDWNSQSLAADVAPMFRYMMPGQPWEAPEHYWKHSTLSQVGKVNTPVMLQAGELDHRTPFSHAEQYYQALKFRDIDTVLVRFAGESHGTSSRPSHGLQSIELVLSWFERYRQPAEEQ